MPFVEFLIDTHLRFLDGYLQVVVFDLHLDNATRFMRHSAEPQGLMPSAV